MGIRQAEIDECLADFKSLAAKAFTKRPLSDTPLLGTLIEGYFHSKYRTGSLEKALKAAFGQEPLFGAQVSSSQAYPVSTRVGVTTCMESDQTAFLLANYNRPRTDCCEFDPQHNRLWPCLTEIFSISRWRHSVQILESSQPGEGDEDLGSVGKANPLWLLQKR